MKRPHYIKHWKEVEAPEQVRPPMMDESFGYVGEFAPEANISHLRIAHMRLPPGTRAYPPMALRSLEIFAFVLEGTPDLWVDGHLHRLNEGDGICLASHTGIVHAVMNNSAAEVRFLSVTEPIALMGKALHPTEPKAAESLKTMGAYWDDAPRRMRGPNSGKPGDMSGKKRGKPGFVTHWRDIVAAKAWSYPGSKEQHGISAPFGRRARFSRIGVHVEVLKPGRRTSWPHAERDEDEFVFVVSGKVDAWNDGSVAPLEAGDFIGWEAGTGIAHTIINNSDEDAVLIVGGEASRERSGIWYPFHPKRNKEFGDRFWSDHPPRKLGPHDGMPDALRKKKKRR